MGLYDIYNYCNKTNGPTSQWLDAYTISYKHTRESSSCIRTRNKLDAMQKTTCY